MRARVAGGMLGWSRSASETVVTCTSARAAMSARVWYFLGAAAGSAAGRRGRTVLPGALDIDGGGDLGRAELAGLEVGHHDGHGAFAHEVEVRPHAGELVRHRVTKAKAGTGDILWHAQAGTLDHFADADPVAE